jgi:hypothetical protein
MLLRVKLGLLLSQSVNALAFCGDPDESLSARAWREQREGWIRRIDRFLGAGHCQAVLEQQRGREEARRTSH